MPIAPKKKKRPWIATPKQDKVTKYIYDTVYNTRRWQKLRRIQLTKRLETMHKKRDAINEQQRQMQSSMTAEELLNEIEEQLILGRKDYMQEASLERAMNIIDEHEQECLNLINQFKKDIEDEAYERGHNDGMEFAKDIGYHFPGPYLLRWP